MIKSLTNTPPFPTSVRDAMHAIERGFILTEIDYVFPSKVIEKNKEKRNKLIASYESTK